jgi:signal transduction histidine kinase
LALTAPSRFAENQFMAFDLTRNASEETPSERYAVDMKLHDETIQALYGVSLRLQAAAGLVDEAPDALPGELDHAIRAIDNIIADLRDRIEDVTAGDQDQPPGYLT